MNERGEITTNTNEIRRIIRNFSQQLYAIKLSNLEEREADLETYKLPILKQEEIDFLNRPINDEEIESVINHLPKHKTPSPDSFPGGNSNKHLRRNNTYSPKAIPKNRNRRIATKLIL